MSIPLVLRTRIMMIPITEIDRIVGTYSMMRKKVWPRLTCRKARAADSDTTTLPITVSTANRNDTQELLQNSLSLTSFAKLSKPTNSRVLYNSSHLEKDRPIAKSVGHSVKARKKTVYGKTKA